MRFCVRSSEYVFSLDRQIRAKSEYVRFFGPMDRWRTKVGAMTELKLN